MAYPRHNLSGTARTDCRPRQTPLRPPLAGTLGSPMAVPFVTIIGLEKQGRTGKTPRDSPTGGHRTRMGRRTTHRLPQLTSPKSQVASSSVSDGADRSRHPLEFREFSIYQHLHDGVTWLVSPQPTGRTPRSMKLQVCLHIPFPRQPLRALRLGSSPDQRNTSAKTPCRRCLTESPCRPKTVVPLREGDLRDAFYFVTDWAYDGPSRVHSGCALVVSGSGRCHGWWCRSRLHGRAAANASTRGEDIQTVCRYRRSIPRPYRSRCPGRFKNG